MRQQVIDAISKLIQDGKVFTAFDVTQVLRDDGIIVRHHDVRSIVQGLWMSQDPVFDGMERDQILIKQINEPSLAYHKPGQDPNDHPNVVKPDDDDGVPGVGAGVRVPDPLPRSFGGVPGLTPPTPPVAKPVVSTAKPVGGKVTLEVEAEGRLNVPTGLIRDVLNAGPGDSVVAIVDGGSIKLVNANDVQIGDGTDQHIYTVTVRGNVRLAPEILALVDATAKAFSCDVASRCVC